jgi:hypothetical protein
VTSIHDLLLCRVEDVNSILFSVPLTVRCHSYLATDSTFLSKSFIKHSQKTSSISAKHLQIICPAEHYNETLGVIHRMFRHIFEGLEARYSKELAVIRWALMIAFICIIPCARLTTLISFFFSLYVCLLVCSFLFLSYFSTLFSSAFSASSPSLLAHFPIPFPPQVPLSSPSSIPYSAWITVMVSC